MRRLQGLSFIAAMCIVVAAAVAGECLATDPWYDKNPQYLEGQLPIRAAVVVNGGIPRTDDSGGVVKIPRYSGVSFRLYYYDANQPEGSKLVSRVCDNDTWSDPALYSDTLETNWLFEIGDPVTSSFTSIDRLYYPNTTQGFSDGPVVVTWKVHDLGYKFDPTLPEEERYHIDAKDSGILPIDDPDYGFWDAKGQLYVEVVDDTTPPGTPVVTDDGFVTASRTQLHAIWQVSDDESGVGNCMYAIGTAQYPNPGYNSVTGFVSAGPNTSITRGGLNLTVGTTYYISVKAVNGVGMWGQVGVSDGITVVSYAYSYDSCNTKTTKSINGTITTYTYDERQRLMQVKHRKPDGSSISGAVVNYRLDDAGNRTELWFDEDPVGKKTSYDYDAVNRLWKVNGQEKFTYDWVGNRLFDGTVSYSYDTADRLYPSSYSYWGTGSLHQVPGSPTRTFIYDERELLTEVWN